MFFKILRNDLKRKKAMNIILFTFMVMASLLIGSSSNLLYSTATAIDYFIQKSKVTDLIAVASDNETISDRINTWAQSSDIIQNYNSEEMLFIDEKGIHTREGVKLKETTTMTLATMPKDYNMVFDQEGETFTIGDLEAAVPVYIQKKLNLKTGDFITINQEGYSKEFKVTKIFKDALLGGELMGMKRIILSETDYHEYKKRIAKEKYINIWNFTKTNASKTAELEREFSRLSIPSYSVMTQAVVHTVYIMDMILAILMMIVSIFLIIISFLILRFTIVFTVMEDYKQIGVMKAIGLKNSKIRNIYTVKYLAMSIIAGIIGFLCSIPISGVLKSNISEYILLQESSLTFFLSLISVIVVIGITILFCNLSTGKIKKISAIDAIRQGNTGERFKNTRKIKLYRRKKIHTPLFLAISDLVSDFKKFIILIITYILGTAIIIIPNNVISTLSTEEAITMFGLIKSDFYVDETMLGGKAFALDKMKELSEDFQKEGINTTLRADLNAMIKVYAEDEAESKNLLSVQGVGINAKEYEYIKGDPPVLENEIAVTEIVAQFLDVTIGDSIHCIVNETPGEFIITALFQSMNNLGNSVRFADSFNGLNNDTSSITISGILKGSKKEKERQIETLKTIFPELEIKSCSEYTETILGSITQQIASIKNLILAIVLGINFLITTLLLRMLLSKELPEIAILKSLGFGSFHIKLWQIYRIGLVLLLSIILGTILANTTGNFLTGGIFRIMGVTRLQLKVEPLQVYGIYPAILFIVTMAAVLFSLGQIKKTNVWNLNHQE
ncbi:MAG: hypothetical protein K0S47_824 [Herbinix sp.]|nr:hypothetical protein [Herbinix sp.]